MALSVRPHDGRPPFLLVDDTQGVVEDVRRFLDALSIRGLSGQTIRAYAFDTLLLYRWLECHDLTLSQLDQQLLLQWVARQRGQDAKPSSINRRLSAIRQLYLFCFGHELPSSKGACLPAPHYTGRTTDRDLGLHHRKGARPQLWVKVPQKLVEPLEQQQVVAFFHSIRRYRDISLVMLMLLCGLRSMEVLALQVEDVSFLDRRLRVRGKGSKERSLPLPEMVVGSLSSYLRLERPARCSCKELFVVLQGRGYGQPMTVAGLRSLFRYRRCTQQSIANANPHRFRHTFGSDMARCGVRLPVLQRMMGHCRPETTLQYINLSLADVADELRRAMAQLQKRYQQS